MKTKPIQMFVVTILVLAASAQAQVTQQWVARYPGTGSGDNRANALAINNSGNVYVTGATPNAYATVAYDTNGNQLWAAQYANGGIADAIALDNAGNVYVTGSGSVFPVTGYTTVSYDANGNQRWVATYHGSGDLSIATGIAVDSFGNVYVTGRSNGDTVDSWAYATISYDTNGNQRWVSRYPVARGGARAIALDSSGNVYVTGSGDSETNFVTIAYDTNGNQLWVARYPGPAGGDGHVANAVTVDSTGTIYVTGQHYYLNGRDAVTVAYDLNGNQLWVSTFVSGEGYSIAADGLGNVFVGGDYDSTDMDYLTVAYAGNGDQLWASVYDGPFHGGEHASAIAIDVARNIYVTGNSTHSSQANNYDYATVAYDNGGNQLWAARYEGDGHIENVANAIAVDSSGNIYVTGFSGDGVVFDFVTIKYSQP